MASGGGGNFGPRLLVMLLAAGVVALGVYPIKKHYGGARGLLNSVLPIGENFKLPDAQSIRSYLLSLDEQRKRRASEGENAEVVKTVKLTPGASAPVETTKRDGGLFSGVARFFNSLGSANERTPDVAKQASRDKTERARLASAEGGSGDGAIADGGSVDRGSLDRGSIDRGSAKATEAKAKSKPKEMDRLSQKDREELNKLIDGF